MESNPWAFPRKEQHVAKNRICREHREAEIAISHSSLSALVLEKGIMLL